jgi:hypothetical protein
MTSRRRAATGLTEIDDVVVEEGGAVDELDGDGQLLRRGAEAAPGARGQGHAQRTQSLAAEVEEMMGAPGHVARPALQRRQRGLGDGDVAPGQLGQVAEPLREGGQTSAFGQGLKRRQDATRCGARSGWRRFRGTWVCVHLRHGTSGRAAAAPGIVMNIQ